VHQAEWTCSTAQVWAATEGVSAAHGPVALWWLQWRPVGAEAVASARGSGCGVAAMPAASRASGALDRLALGQVGVGSNEEGAPVGPVVYWQNHQRQSRRFTRNLTQLPAFSGTGAN
jgi:hypothetical protein